MFVIDGADDHSMMDLPNIGSVQEIIVIFVHRDFDTHVNSDLLNGVAQISEFSTEISCGIANDNEMTAPSNHFV